MKLISIAVVSVAVLLPVFAQAQDMSGMNMDDMEGMSMQAQAQQAAIASADGTIKAIDAAKHTVTLAHGAVPAVQWPPMTMGFAVTPDQLKGLAVGDHVAFSFRLDGGKATIVSIKK